MSELQHTTLVAVIGLLRSPGVTWLNFRHHVLNPALGPFLAGNDDLRKWSEAQGKNAA